MNPYAIPHLIVSLLAVSLAFVVLLKNSKSRVNKLFFFESLSISLWIFSEFVMFATTSAETARLGARIAYIGVSFIPPFFILFANAFIGNKENKKITASVFIFAAILTFFVFTSDYLISGAKRHFWGFYPEVGPFHFIYVIYIFIMFGSPLVSLYRHYRTHKFSAQERNQRRFMILAFTFVLSGAVDFLPKYGVEMYPAGALFVGTWLVLVAYAIVRYRAMDVKFVINRGTAYALTFFLGILPVGIIIFFFQKVFPLTVPITLVLLLSVALSFLFYKIHPFSERLVQNKLSKSQSDYYKILRRFSQEMVTALDLRSLLNKFDQTLRDAMQVTSIAIYLTGPMNGKYPLSHASKGDDDVIPIFRNRKSEPGSKPAPSPESVGLASAHHSDIIPLWKSGDALVAMAYQAKDVLVLGEMMMMARERKNPRLEEAIAQMTEAEVCLPLKRDGKMVGIALLGPREGDRYYSPEDLDLLHTLGQSACVAIQNALLVEEIKRSYQLLQRTQRLTAMGSLVAGVSHEIRNPLMPISFLVDTITESSMDAKLLSRLHEHSQESLRRIISVLDEMDEFARPYTPTFKKAGLNKIVDEAIALLSAQFERSNQEVIKEFETMPEPVVDGERLKQALTDILLNAAEANENSGKIYVRTRKIQLKKTAVRPAREGVQIEITDTGCGIPSENIERVFDPFFTTKHRSLKREGTGLGLAIAHRIVEEHHGSIEVRSTVGQGTSVYVHLPVEA